MTSHNRYLCLPDYDDVGGNRETPRAIHDLESFLWVLIWLGITRGAPASSRSGLNSDPQKAAIPVPLQRFLKQFFEGDLVAMATNKRKAFGSSMVTHQEHNEFLGETTAALSSWLSCLAPLIRSFYNVLAEAYKRREFENDDFNYGPLYTDVLKCFSSALEGLPQNELGAEERALVQKEMERRKKARGIWRLAQGGVGDWEDTPKTQKTLSQGQEELPTELTELRAPKSPSPEQRKSKRQRVAKRG